MIDIIVFIIFIVVINIISEDRKQIIIIMPVCPRCGKCMSSEQALMYHLNKKYKCCTWKCLACSEICNTKFQLQMHEMSCTKITQSKENIDMQYLLNVYNNLPIGVIEIQNDQIKRMNKIAKEKLPETSISNICNIDKHINILHRQDDIIFCT